MTNFLMIILIGLVAIIISRLHIKYSRKMNEKQWIEWQDTLSLLGSDYRYFLGKIVSIRQRAKTGTKAFVYWHGKSSDMQAVWLPNLWPKIGSYILGRGSYGRGRHHNEQVFYFNDEVKVIDYKVFQGFKKHNKRIQ